jgi:hypothetical protein
MSRENWLLLVTDEPVSLRNNRLKFKAFTVIANHVEEIYGINPNFIKQS